MKSQPFGNSGLNLTEIGLGMAALGRPGYINLEHGNDLQHDYSVEAMKMHAHAVLSQAYDLGIRYFDVARSYGRSEVFLSEWIQANKSSDVFCGSKWGYTYTADWSVEAEVHEVKEHRVEVLKRQWEETQANLGENLNIYHIHSATLDSGVLDNKEVLDHLWELKGKGTVMGLSLSGVGQGETLAKALSIRSGAIQLFGSVQLTYNILENSVNEMIRKAVDAGLGIIVKESLANGRLSDRNEEASFSDTKKVLADMAKAYDVGIDALAIAYIQQQSWPSVILSGAATAEQLESNMNACSIELDKSDLKVLFSLHENPSSYWKTRSALAWN